MILNGKIKNESNYLHLIRFWKICRRKHRRPVCVSFWAFPGLLRYKAKPCMSSPRSLAGHLPIKEVSPQERAPKHWLVLRRRTTDRNSESILIFPSGWQRPKYLGPSTWVTTTCCLLVCMIAGSWYWEHSCNLSSNIPIRDVIIWSGILTTRTNACPDSIIQKWNKITQRIP